MNFGVVWEHKSPETGEVRKLISSLESLEGVETVEVAKSEGRVILRELSSEHKISLQPLAVVEISEDMLETLQFCPEVRLPCLEHEEELEFIDVGETEFWVRQPWWFR